MSQNDYVIANQTTPLFRADLNSALQALASNSSGATAPATTYANMLWYDTAANILKMRNEANSVWISLGTLDQSLGTFTASGVLALATQAQAEAGTDNTTLMTPLRTSQAIPARTAALAVGSVGTYALAYWIGVKSFVAGTTYAGTSLYYAGLSIGDTITTGSRVVYDDESDDIAIGPGTDTRVALSGTWRAMGTTATAVGSSHPATLFLRVA